MSEKQRIEVVSIGACMLDIKYQQENRMKNEITRANQCDLFGGRIYIQL
jgi:hypothetical protein